MDKVVRVGDKQVQMVIWDTAGQERFHALGPIYYRDADAALLVFDITDLDSFAKVKNWVKELRKMVGSEIVLTIAGNKADLERQRLVTRQQASEYASSVGAHYCETSAKLGRGIDEVFSNLAIRLLQLKKTTDEGVMANGTRYGNGLLVVDDEPPSKSSGCC